MTFRALFAGCWFSHDHVRTRDDDQKPVLRCINCGDEQPMFASKLMKGPKAIPDRVLGAPTGTAKLLRPSNVSDIRERRQSER